MGEHGRVADSRKILNNLLGAAELDDAVWLEAARKQRAESGLEVFSELIRLLIHVRIGEKEAEQTWPRLLEHRAEMSSQVGRDVGLLLAVFDWFINVDPRLKEPTIMELSQYEKTERSAMTDWLTGLYNRGAFRASALRELRRAQRYRQSLSFIFFDMDDFKTVNDRFGHERGDLVLRETSRLLRRSVRDVDVAARYGGEEFSVLLPETGRAGAVAVAERVRHAVIKQTVVRDPLEEPLKLTISGGVAVYPEDGDELGELLRQADAALYRAKAAGKNTIVSQWIERRHARRLALGSPRALVTVSPDGDGRTLAGAARDISRTGLGLTLHESIEVGQRVGVNFEDLERVGPLAMTGRVVRHTALAGPSGERLFEVGVGLEEDCQGRAAAAMEAIASVRGGGADPSVRTGHGGP